MLTMFKETKTYLKLEHSNHILADLKKKSFKNEKSNNLN